MLAGELKAYSARVAAGEVATVPAASPQPPSLAGLHLGSNAAPMVSQSLPSGAHSAFAGAPAPPRPRMGPSAPTGVSALPILELPEPSPHSSSLLDAPMRPSDPDMPDVGDDEGEDEFVGGTSMLDASAGAVAARGNFVYAASAPATMLWGPVGHRFGGSSHMGGRSSATLLEALSNRDVREKGGS